MNHQMFLQNFSGQNNDMNFLVNNNFPNMSEINSMMNFKNSTMKTNSTMTQEIKIQNFKSTETHTSSFSQNNFSGNMSQINMMQNFNMGKNQFNFDSDMSNISMMNMTNMNMINNFSNMNISNFTNVTNKTQKTTNTTKKIVRTNVSTKVIIDEKKAAYQDIAILKPAMVKKVGGIIQNLIKKTGFLLQDKIKTDLYVLFRTLTISNNISSLKFNQDGNYLSMLTADGILNILNVVDWKFLQDYSFGDIEANIINFAFSFNGNFLFTACDEYFIIYHKINQNSVSCSKIPFNGKIVAFSLSADSQYFAFSSTNNDLNIFQFIEEDYEQIDRFVDISENITSLAFSGDNQYLAVGTASNFVFVYELCEKNFEYTITLKNHSSDITYVTFSSDGIYFASASSDKIVNIYKISNGTFYVIKTIKEFNNQQISKVQLEFSSDTKYFAFSIQIDGINIYEIVNDQFCLTTKFSEKVSSFSFSPDSQCLAISLLDSNIIKIYLLNNNNIKISNSTVNIQLNQSKIGMTIIQKNSNQTRKVVNLDSFGLYQSLELSNDEIYYVTFSGDTKFLVVGTKKGFVFIYYINNAQFILIEKFELKGYINSIGFSYDNIYLCVATQGGNVYLYRFRNNKFELQQTMNFNGSYSSISFSNINNFLAIGTDKSAIQMFQIKDGSLTKMFELDVCYCMKFSYDNKYFAFINEKTTFIYSINNNQFTKITTLKDHTEKILDLVFSPDGNYFATSGYDNSVIIYTIFNGQFNKYKQIKNFKLKYLTLHLALIVIF